MIKKKKKKKKKAIGQLLVPIPDSNLSALPSLTTVAVGSEIYAIGGPVSGAPSSALRVLDCRSDTWRDAPSMNVARRYALSCVYDGKIYVTGGCKGVDDEAWAEVFDTKTQTWERLPDPGY
uniref:F-box/kelch-repeat protein n=1 Tax=Noccaea caerulescens TaxID=107243 RepID=A0A1J3JT90_NOCCA